MPLVYTSTLVLLTLLYKFPPSLPPSPSPYLPPSLPPSLTPSLLPSLLPSLPPILVLVLIAFVFSLVNPQVAHHPHQHVFLIFIFISSFLLINHVGNSVHPFSYLTYDVVVYDDSYYVSDCQSYHIYDVCHYGIVVFHFDFCCFLPIDM